MKKPTLEQLVARTTNILANLVTVIQKRGDYNLDEYSNKIAALYSSTEQGAELNNKLREQFATLIWHYWEQHFAYPKSAHLYGCVDELFKLLKSLPTEQEIREKYEAKIKELEAYKKEEPAFEAMIKREAKSKILSVVDKALLKDEQIKLELTKYAHEIMSSNPIRDWNQTELIKIVAKAQLQAIKSILKGK